MIIKEIRERMVKIGEELAEIEKKEAPKEEDEIRTDKLITEFKELKDKEEEEIKAEEKRTGRKKDVVELRDHLKKSITEPIKPIIEKGEGEFASFGEFVKTVRFSPNDPRLEVRELEEGTDTKGGFLVPDEFIDVIRKIDPYVNIVRPRATVIPAGDRPDQKILMPALDQTTADGSGMYGGVVVEWIEEGATKTETDTAFKEITLDPKEVAGHITISDKLLRNAPAVDALVKELFRGAINAAEESEFLAGANPATRPTGIISHAGTIAVNRTTASRIIYADIVNMFANMLAGATYVWIGSISTLPQLMKMKDFEAAESDAPSLIWQPNARVGVGGTLLGIPLLLSDQVPALGTKGDLLLADLRYYLIKDGFGIAIAASEHVYFTKNKTVIKAFWNVDGKPWLTAPLTLRDGSTEVSPFVVLDVPEVGS